MAGRKQTEECQSIEKGIKTLLFSPSQNNQLIKPGSGPPLPNNSQNDSRNNNNSNSYHVDPQQERSGQQQGMGNRNRPAISPSKTSNRRGYRPPPQTSRPTPQLQQQAPKMSLQQQQLASQPPLQQQALKQPQPNQGVGNPNREFFNQNFSKPATANRGGGGGRRKNRTQPRPQQDHPLLQTPPDVARMSLEDGSPTPPRGGSSLSSREAAVFRPVILAKSQLELLEDNHIDVLQKPLLKAPEARFACILCTNNFTYFDKVKQHLKSQIHARRMKEEKLRKELQMMMFPSDGHLRALTGFLEEVFYQESISRQEEELRKECHVALQSLLDCEPLLETCKVRLFHPASGSLLRSIETSFDLVLQKADNPAVKLNLVFELLKKRKDIFSEVRNDLYAKYPRIMFHALQFNLDCSLYLMSNPNFFLMSRLLQDYTRFNPVMEKLSTIFHLLAKVCELDLQDKGALPPHAFPIMVVYFLQQYSPPLLPVLHHFTEENDYPNVEKALKHWSNITSQPSLGELWIKLLRFYALDFEYGRQVVTIVTDRFVNVQEKNWAPRMMAIEEPFNTKRNMARSFSTQEVFSYFLENICCAYKYFVQTQDVTNGGNYNWNFKRQNFNPTMAPLPIVCSTCSKMGHLKEDCPEYQLPPLEPLAPLPSSYENELTDVCLRLFCDLQPTTEETSYKYSLLNSLRTYIKQIYEDAILEIFGSSLNGFGFKKCDMDICLTFKNRTCEEMEQTEVQRTIIEQLAQHLERNSSYEHIIPITTAKVPIVKLKFKNTEMEADISLYNTLAMHNTELLRTYTLIDKRAQVLGFVMKHFAKLFEIGDASTGSLSSYAYILMVIYFLQQRDPPILPVLQELGPATQARPTRLVKDWDTWFFDDTAALQKMWPEGGRNEETIGHLLVEMFKFYTEKFQFDKFVISIRQHKPMSRLDKLWTSKCIVIEDPFELTHNLGSGLSRRMDMFIKKAFIAGRKHFGVVVNPAQHHHRSLKNYLFNKEFLTNGMKPPKERCCHICHKIGHRAKDCQRRRPTTLINNNYNNDGGKFRRRGGRRPQGDMDEMLPPNPFLQRHPVESLLSLRHLPMQLTRGHPVPRPAFRQTPSHEALVRQSPPQDLRPPQHMIDPRGMHMQQRPPGHYPGPPEHYRNSPNLRINHQMAPYSPFSRPPYYYNNK